MRVLPVQAQLVDPVSSLLILTLLLSSLQLFLPNIGQYKLQPSSTVPLCFFLLMCACSGCRRPAFAIRSKVLTQLPPFRLARGACWGQGLEMALPSISVLILQHSGRCHPPPEPQGKGRGKKGKEAHHRSLLHILKAWLSSTYLCIVGFFWMH